MAEIKKEYKKASLIGALGISLSAAWLIKADDTFEWTFEKFFGGFTAKESNAILPTDEESKQNFLTNLLLNISEDQANNEEYTIHLVAKDLDILGGTLKPNHNYISVRNSDKTEILSIHGLAISRFDGIPEGIGNNKDTLRVFFRGKDPWDPVKSYKTDKEIEIYRGKTHKIERKILQAMDGGNFINQQNLVYDLYEMFGDAQNSNSVARAIVHAMGLEFPEEIADLWAPGHNRQLIPTNWRSKYDNPKIKPQEIREILNTIYDGRNIENMRKMDEENILNDVLKDSPPSKERQKFINPEEPFVQYTPIENNIK